MVWWSSCSSYFPLPCPTRLPITLLEAISPSPCPFCSMQARPISLVSVHDSTLLPVIFSTSTICLYVMSEVQEISSVHSFQQPTPSTANLAAFLRSTGPPDLPSFPSTTNTISKSVRSKSVPRRWLRRVASKIGMRKEKPSPKLFPESPHLSIREFKDG